MWSIADTDSYLASSNELFFNLNDQGAGPVLGFEEDRLFAGVGYHFGRHLRAEIGYMWRPVRRRSLRTGCGQRSMSSRISVGISSLTLSPSFFAAS